MIWNLHKTYINIVLLILLISCNKMFYPRFAVTYILSTPHDGWTGSHGRISQPLVEQSMPTDGERTLFCACGPTAFTNEAQR